jgi:hypothetical protein
MFTTGSPTSRDDRSIGGAHLGWARHAEPARDGHGRAGAPASRRTALVLATVAIVATVGCATSAEAGPVRTGSAPVLLHVSAHATATAPCLGTADAVQHWSEGAGRPACVLALRERARVTLGLPVERSSSSTWVCPTTADAAEHWVRAIGVAGCRG